MSNQVVSTRKPPQGRVYGRIETPIDGVVVRVEMRRDGIWLRRKYTRRRVRLSFLDAWQVASGQGLFQFKGDQT